MTGTMISTVFSGSQRLEEREEMEFKTDKGIEKQAVNLHPEETFQAFEGFGGAFTDSAGYVYAQMNDADREKLIADYFRADRMNYRLGRIHIDSCDFSTDQYEAMSDANDRELRSFSLERTKRYILPLVQDAQAEMGKPVELMVTPWSPPAFMKTNGERSHGGKLKKGCEAYWADYICKYIKMLREEGLLVRRMSIQNEPAAVQTWDSCIFSAAEERDFLKDYLYPAFVKYDLKDVEIFIWDHNKERLYERACTIITEETSHMVAGLAFHWYSGDHFEALDLVRKRFPDKKLILSEACIEYSIYGTGSPLANAQKYAHDIIGNLNAGMHAFYDWNLLLDAEGGPNHVGNLCDAPYMYDIEHKKLIERNTLAYIWHFSHFIQPKAVRIGFSRYTSALDVTAFQNPDGGIVGVIMNTAKEKMPVYIRLSGQVAQICMRPESIATFMIKTGQNL